MGKTKVRKLTVGELKILKLIQQEYGPQNIEEDVFFSDEDEAVIFAKAPDDTPVIVIVLTNLADWRENGMIKSDEELLNEWIRIPHNKK